MLSPGSSGWHQPRAGTWGLPKTTPGPAGAGNARPWMLLHVALPRVGLGHRAGAMTEIPAALRCPEPRPGTIPVFPARPSSAAPQNQPIPQLCLLSQAPATAPCPGRMQDPALTLIPVFSKMKGKHADFGIRFPAPSVCGLGFPSLSKAPPAAAPAEGQIPVPRAGDGAGSVQEQPSGTAIPALGSCHVLGKCRVPPTPSKAIKALN